jgi:hypothetical protein
MARKPNYQFERMERDRAKAAKVAEKTAARQREREQAAAAAEPPAAPPSKEED